MRLILTSVLALVLFSSCGSSKPRVVTTVKEQEKIKPVIRTKKDAKKSEHVVFVEKTEEDKRASRITNYALDFKGTPYKFGGTTKRGMDCSGLVYTSFKTEDIELPRTSRAMSLQGTRLKLDEVNEGDLLFFETNKNRKVINHVGLVVGLNDEDILFIHSTSSRGVIVSNFSEAYWQNAFVMARRVL